MIDRSNLAKIYPEAKPDSQNSKVNGTSAKETEIKIPFWRILMTAIFLTVAIVSLILFYNYLNQSVNMNDLTNFVSQMIEVLLAWAGIFIAVLIGVFWSLNHTNIKKPIFLIMYALYAIPTSQLTYNLFYRFNNKTVSTVPFSIVLLVENFIFVFLIMKIMNSTKMSDTTKSILVIATIAYSVIIVIIGSVISR
jgi:hypothetical protein